MVGLSGPAINRAIRGKDAPRCKRGPTWADALGLRGEDRRQFLEALDLANSPPSIRRLVRRLKKQAQRRPDLSL